MTLEETQAELEYIAASPPKEFGGFNERVVKAAQAALEHLNSMAKRLENVRSHGEVYIYPEGWNCAKMGGRPDIEAYEKIDLSDA